MARSRLLRVQEGRERKRILISVLGIFAIIAFIVFFGLKLLVGFSLLVLRIQGASPTPAPSQSILIAPVLNPLPEATNSASLTLTGSATGGTTLILYLNDSEEKKVSVPSDGTFSIPLTLKEGASTLSAKITDEKGNISNLSNVISVLIKKSAPAIEVDEPPDGSTVTSAQNTITVRGKVEENSSVTVNGRLAIVSADGSFRLIYGLSEGDNSIRIVATDPAGNQTTIDRKVTYKKL